MNISQVRAQKLEERMLEFALECINLSKEVAPSDGNRVILDQLVRSATSIGANYTEANNAVSRLDFRNKIYTSKKEAAESRYWLRLLSKSNAEVDINLLIDECTQLLLILQKSASTLKNGK